MSRWKSLRSAWGNLSIKIKIGCAGLIPNYILICSVDIGYAYGFLLSKEIDEAYHSLLYTLIGDKWYDKVSFT